MPDVVSLCTLTAENVNASTKDQTKLAVVVSSPAALTDVQLSNLWDVFGDNSGAPTNRLWTYLASCVSRAAPAKAAAYDITAHLDGSVHGSPYVTTDRPLLAALGDSRGNQICAVFSWQDGDYATTPTTGPSAAIPTPEAAIDMGAPATHPGQTRPKSRHSNRMYFGPVDGSAIGVDGSGNPQWTDTFMEDAAGSLAFFRDHVPSVTGGAVWQVWSRRNAAISVVEHGWVDRGLKTRRRKTFVPNLKTTW